MKNLFKPEDFVFYQKQSADIANKILSDYLEKEGVRVYMINSDISVIQTISREKTPYDKYTTVIFPPEPIVKEKCEHKRIANWQFDTETQTTCLDCHKRLNVRTVFEEAE